MRLGIFSSRVAVVAGAVILACQGVVSDAQSIQLTPIGYFRTGLFNVSALEIGAFDSKTKRFIAINGSAPRFEIFDLSKPSLPVLVKRVDISEWGGSANSVSAYQGIVAVAIENEIKTDPGTVALFDTEGVFLDAAEAGALPDMVTFTPDGRHVLVANEGEPSEDYSVDPEGSITLADVEFIAPGRARFARVHRLRFDSFDAAELDASVRVFGPGASLAQDLEPEYVAVSPDSRRAWVSLQENNAMAIVDIRARRITEIVGLGFKDHSLPRNALDVSDKDKGIFVYQWPVFGMYQPDALAAYRVRGQTYVISANEGDVREWGEYSEGARVASLKLDLDVFSFADALQDDERLGRLVVTTTRGDVDGDEEFEALYAFGGRSFSIWTSQGKLVWDSGSELERLVARELPEDFNATDDENDSMDARSDDKGPEPEGVVVGTVGNRQYAFIGLERVGGVVTYDVTRPAAPEFVDYVNTRNFSGDPGADTAGDLAPEGLVFVSASESPIGVPLVIVLYEVSGSFTVFRIDDIN